MKAITLWKSLEKDEQTKESHWVHHHIEDGHVQFATAPLPYIDENGVPFASQKGWKGMQWQKEHAFLDDNYKVIHTNI